MSQTMTTFCVMLCHTSHAQVHTHTHTHTGSCSLLWQQEQRYKQTDSSDEPHEIQMEDETTKPIASGDDVKLRLVKQIWTLIFAAKWIGAETRCIVCVASFQIQAQWYKLRTNYLSRVSHERQHHKPLWPIYWANLKHPNRTQSDRCIIAST